MPPVSPATQVISAIVTPAILILACSSLITATATRLSRLLERVRDVIKEMEAGAALSENRKAFLSSQLPLLLRRARLLQNAMLSLYLALGALILTSVVIGVSYVAGAANVKLILACTLASVALLFAASLILIREARIALRTVTAEMEYAKHLI